MLKSLRRATRAAKKAAEARERATLPINDRSAEVCYCSGPKFGTGKAGKSGRRRGQGKCEVSAEGTHARQIEIVGCS